MRDLLYKEFKLAINPGFFLVALFGALIMIPGWLYFIAVMYILFIAMPNIFVLSKAQNDIGFSVMLPVKKRDVVKARVLSVAVLQLLTVLVSMLFAVANLAVYGANSFFMIPNVAFFGLVFVMYALFNIVFFPGFYKTAYKVGAPAVWANAAAILFAAAVEAVNIISPAVHTYIGGINNLAGQLPVLAAGILIYVLSAVIAFKVSAARFERVDI